MKPSVTPGTDICETCGKELKIWDNTDLHNIIYRCENGHGGHEKEEESGVSYAHMCNGIAKNGRQENCSACRPKVEEGCSCITPLGYESCGHSQCEQAGFTRGVRAAMEAVKGTKWCGEDKCGCRNRSINALKNLLGEKG